MMKRASMSQSMAQLGEIHHYHFYQLVLSSCLTTTSYRHTFQPSLLLLTLASFSIRIQEAQVRDVLASFPTVKGAMVVNEDV